MSLWSAFTPWLLLLSPLMCTHVPTTLPLETKLCARPFSLHPDTQPTSFHWTPYSMSTVTLSSPNHLVPPPLPSSPMAHSLRLPGKQSELTISQVVGCPVSRCCSFFFPPLLLSTLWLAKGRKAQRKNSSTRSRRRCCDCRLGCGVRLVLRRWQEGRERKAFMYIWGEWEKNHLDFFSEMKYLTIKKIYISVEKLKALTN